MARRTITRRSHELYPDRRGWVQPLPGNEAVVHIDPNARTLGERRGLRTKALTPTIPPIDADRPPRIGGDCHEPFRPLMWASLHTVSYRSSRQEPYE